MASYLATNYRIGDGVTTVWNVSFAGARPDQGDGTEAYLDPESVSAVLITLNDDGTESTTPVSGELIGPTQYKIVPAVAVDQTIKIFRTTERGYPLVDFTDFAAITENDLDIQARQTLYVVQELADQVAYSDERSVEARRIADEASDLTVGAVSDAAEALTVASRAESASAGARTLSQQASQTATSADSKADSAVGAATTATTTANAASQTANSALTQAGTATTTANQAKQTATAASTASGNAVTTANAARTLAETAATDASTARTTAAAAQETAQKASNDANVASSVADDVTNFRGELDTLADRVEQLVGTDASDLMVGSNNLSELTDVDAARVKLDVHSKAAITSLLNTERTRITGNENAITALRAIEITAGTGLSGGGTLTANRTLTVDSTVVRTSRTVQSGAGLSGGGSLANDQAIALGTPSTVSGATSNSLQAESHTHAVASTRSRTTSSNSELLLAGAMTDHVGSTDHDNRYYTKAAADQRTELVGGYVRTPPANLCYFQVPKYNQQRINTASTAKITFVASGGESRTSPWYYPSAYYDRGTSEFVAPVAGVYEFYAQVMRAGGNNGATAVDFRFSRNGQLLNGANGQTGPQGFAPGQGDLGVSTFLAARIEMTVELAAGERIGVGIGPSDVTIHANNSGESVPTYWGGRLL